jgi:hypothetical protein
MFKINKTPLVNKIVYNNTEYHKLKFFLYNIYYLNNFSFKYSVKVMFSLFIRLINIIHVYIYVTMGKYRVNCLKNTKETDKLSALQKLIIY